MTSWPICVYERLLNFWPIAINCITTSGSRIGMQIRIQFSYRPMADHYQSNAQQRAGRTDQKAIGQRTTTEDEESPLDDHRTSVLYTLEASSVSICLSVRLSRSCGRRKPDNQRLCLQASESHNIGNLLMNPETIQRSQSSCSASSCFHLAIYLCASDGL